MSEINYKYVNIKLGNHKPPVFKIVNNQDWIEFGVEVPYKNNYPKYIQSLYERSNMHSAFLKAKHYYICGNGITVDKTAKTIGDVSALLNELKETVENGFINKDDVVIIMLSYPYRYKSKDIVLSSTVDLQRGKFQFSYTTGEDIFSQQYKNVNRVYGDYEVAGYTINPDTAPSDFAIGDQKIQLVTRSLPAGVVNGSGYVIPMFFDSSLRFKVPGPHCLFEAGSYAVALYNDNTSAVVTTNVSTLNHYSVINADIDDEDLNFAPEVPPHPIVTNPFNNLFNTYWRSYMNSLLQKADIKINDTCVRLIKDLKYVEVDNEGDIKKDRSSEFKMSDFLDCFRYYCFAFHHQFIKIYA